MKQSYKYRIVMLLLIILTSTSAAVKSSDQDTIRIRIGLKLFRTLLAADTGIHTKVDKEQKLALALIYKSDAKDAESYSQQLQNSGKNQNKGKIKGIPIDVHPIASDQLELLSTHRYAGIYIVEKLDANALQQIINHAIQQRIISYSPFIGAVEQGVSAGLVIEARVKPYINLDTLDNSQITIKPFFLKVAKHYEP